MDSTLMITRVNADLVRVHWSTQAWTISEVGITAASVVTTIERLVTGCEWLRETLPTGFLGWSALQAVATRFDRRDRCWKSIQVAASAE